MNECMIILRTRKVTDHFSSAHIQHPQQLWSSSSHARQKQQNLSQLYSGNSPQNLQPPNRLHLRSSLFRPGERAFGFHLESWSISRFSSLSLALLIYGQPCLSLPFYYQIIYKRGIDPRAKKQKQKQEQNSLYYIVSNTITHMTTIRPCDMGICDSTINEVAIQSISWGKFKGPVPENPPYYAHIFWNIDYRYYFYELRSNKPTVVARPYISSRSWKREQHVNDKLLRHQYGHYLIGCLCALKFQEKVSKSQGTFGSKNEAIKFCATKFQETLCQYLEIQKKYDEETEHYYNEKGQAKWQQWIVEQINAMSPTYKRDEGQPIAKGSRSVQKTQQSSRSESRGSRQKSRSKDKENRGLSTVQKVVFGMSVLALIAVFVFGKRR